MADDNPHAAPPPEDWVELTDPVDGTRWQIDRGFVDSSWRCLWGRGCQGILDHPAEELNQGCCSVGAELLDDDEARRIGALGATLDPDRFQFHEAAADGLFAEGSRSATRVVDGACIFLNRPGFDGGEGCALHLAAEVEGESPIDWKPSVCWQLPIKVDVEADGTRRLRRWGRADWGDEPVAWCCTEDREPADAYDGDERVVDSLADELTALVGREVMVELRRLV